MIKKAMRKFGYYMTWPFAQIFRLASYLDDHDIGTLLTGFVFALYAICIGIVTVEEGFQGGFALFLFIIMMVTGGVSSWALGAIIDILIIVFQPVDQFNRLCSNGNIPGERREKRRIKPRYSNDGNPLDEFIRKSAKTNCYQMEKIK